MMNQKAGLVATMLGAAAIAFYVVMPFAGTVSDRPTVIDLTETGFVPTELHIRVGETVTFTSSLRSQFWPASNLHPAHDIYPEFDPRRPLLPGESWSFTFGRTGTWRFHDHLRSYYTGTIYVE